MSLIDPTVTFRESVLAPDDARLLRRYKKFLLAHALKEKLWCMKCTEAGRQDGVRAIVQDGSILIECRCTKRTYRGQSY